MTAREPHPCAGLWRPMDAMLGPSQGDSLERACEDLLGFTGVTVSWEAIEADPVSFEGLLDRLDRFDVPLRIDLPDGSADRSSSMLPAGLARALDYDPDLVSLPAPRAEPPEESPEESLNEAPQINRWLEAVDGRLGDAEVGLVAKLPSGQNRSHGAIAEDLMGSDTCVALRLDGFAEEQAAELDRRISSEDGSGLAIFAPTWEFASAFRHGVAAVEGDLGLVTGHQAAALSECVTGDLPTALGLERRLLRFVEGPLERSTRDWPAADRQRFLHRLFSFYEAPHETLPADLEGHGGLLQAIESVGFYAPD